MSEAVVCNGNVILTAGCVVAFLVLGVLKAVLDAGGQDHE